MLLAPVFFASLTHVFSHRTWWENCETRKTRIHLFNSYLPNSTKISQIEDVVKLGWRGKHFNLRFLPKLPRAWHQRINHLLQLCRESPLGVKVATTNGTEDLVDRSICGQSTVQDGKLTFQAAWNVIAASSWLNHSCHELNVNYTGEITGFVKTVKTFHLHYLSNDFIGNLKS